MELNGVVKAISGKRKLLVRFHDGCEKNLSSNQLTVVAAHEILVEEAPLVSTIPEIPEDMVESHKGYYVCVYVLLQFKTTSGKRRLLVRFHDGCENNLSSNQLTVVAAHKILAEEAPLVSTIPEIPEDKNEIHKGYYVSVYVILQF